MMKKYLNLTNYNKYIVTKHSNTQNCGHPPNIYYKRKTITFEVVMCHHHNDFLNV